MKRRLCAFLLLVFLAIPLFAGNLDYRENMAFGNREAFQSAFGVELRFSPVRFLLSNPLPLPLESWANLNEKGMTLYSENLFQISEKLLLKTEVLSAFQERKDGNAKLLDGETSVYMDVQFEVKKNLWIDVGGVIPVTLGEILLEP